MSDVDWSKAPEWAQWWAMDHSGAGWWYEGEPILCDFDGIWSNKYGETCGRDESWVLMRKHLNLDWKQTLTARPQEAR